MKYDYLIVGAGLFGAVFAHEAKRADKKVLIIEKRDHIGGNAYTKEVESIRVHWYGPHIFHTSKKPVWEYIQQFTTMNHFVNSPLAHYQGKVYSLPFNMFTFNQLWGVTEPKDAIAIIQEQQSKQFKSTPINLEEQAINLVGPEIYQKFIQGYTEKQWGKPCRDLPPFIIKRIPVRFTYNNNYFNDIYQGVPIGGYTKMIEKMIEGIEVRLNTDYLEDKAYFDNMADKVLYTGCIDAFYEYKLGTLEYRSLRFDHEVIDIPNQQGNAVINYTEASIPYTRIIEHKHFEFGIQPKTVITKEFPDSFSPSKIPYYPINDDKNNNLYQRYRQMANQEDKHIFGGRLAEYKYYDMDLVIESALELARKQF